MWQLPHSAFHRSLGGVASFPPAIASCAMSTMLARTPITQRAVSRIQRLVVSICRFLFERHQVLQNVALLLGGAGASQHVVAVAPEPLVDSGGIAEALGIGGWRERGDGLAGFRMFPCGKRIGGMA